MQVMKNVGLISIVMLVAVALSNNLAAGPVYAAKWKRGGQIVLLYGDLHTTHKRIPDQELLAIKAFSEALQAVTTDTLVLCEDLKTIELFSNQEYEILDSAWNNSFMKAASGLAHVRAQESDSHVKALSIDPRNEVFSLLAMSLAFDESSSSSDQEVMVLHKKAYDFLEHRGIVEMFEQLAINVEGLAARVHDNFVKSFFDEVAGTLRERARLLWARIVADTGLSYDELNQATVGTVVHLRQTDTRYAKLACSYLFNFDLKVAYCAEAFDAEALWHIAGVQDPCQRIVVVAGNLHIRNLEKHLFALGYSQCFAVNEVETCALEEVEHLGRVMQVALDTDHVSRVFPLSPFDSFGLKMFQDEYAEKIVLRACCNPESLTTEQREAKDAFLAKANYKINYEWKVPLIPFETFKWISEPGDLS